MTTKEKFLKEKINNFIIFIDTKIGKENNIYKEFIKYRNDINLFLQAIVQLSTYAKNRKFEPETIEKYLEMNDVKVILEKEDFIKLNRYFDMFIQIIDS